MIFPVSSGSYGNDSRDEYDIRIDNALNYDSSSLSYNTDQNELDTHLKDFELNPIEEVNINTYFINSYVLQLHLYYNDR